MLGGVHGAEGVEGNRLTSLMAKSLRTLEGRCD